MKQRGEGHSAMGIVTMGVKQGPVVGGFSEEAAVLEDKTGP